MDTDKLPPILKTFLEKYLETKLVPVFLKHFTGTVEKKIAETKKPSLSERYRGQGVLGIVGNIVKNTITKKKEKEETTTPSVTEPPKENNLLKTVKAASPSNPATTPEESNTTESAPTTNAPQGGKHLIKDDSATVLIGGISTKGVQNLRRSLPLVFKPILDDFFKRLSITSLKTDIKIPAPTSTQAGGGDDGGLLGTALDFFKKKKGTVAGNFARKRKAAQLRKARSLRTASNTLKTTTSTAAKTGTKAAVETGVKTATETGVKTVAETGVKTAAETGTKAAVETGAKTAAETGTKAAAETGVKAAAETGVKTAAETGTKAAAETGAKTGGKNVLKTATGKVTKAASIAKAAGGSVKARIVESIAKRIPKAMLGALGKSVPLVGALVGAGFAINRLIKGDITGAGLEAVSGLGSAATAIPATALLVAKDVYQDTYGVKPESDPEAGKRFAEVKDATTKAATDFVTKVGEKNKPKEEKKDEKSKAGAVTPAATSDIKTESAAPTDTTPTSVSPETAPSVTPSSPAIQPSTPSVQPSPVPSPATVSTKADNSDILTSISSNTGKTNDLLSALIQAIMKLAQKTNNTSPANNSLAINSSSQQTQKSAADVIASNRDPIRAKRSMFEDRLE